MQLKELNIDEIRPNPFQPREKFKKEELQELADNISKHGLIEPIVVTKKDNKYMVVAGERRWRAHNLAKKNKIFAIIKNYNSDSDIKRDSLVENEMRENLSNEEFKAFTFSLAKSLGEPYYNKGFVNSFELTKYVLGSTSKGVSQSPFCRKIHDFFKIQQHASPKVKKLFDEDKIDRRTATQIASIPDKATQDELAELAKHKSTKEIRQEVQRHNFQQEAKQIRDKIQKESDEIIKHNHEVGIVNKFISKIDGWNYNLDLIVKYTKDQRNIFSKFSHENRMILLDNLKPLRRELEKSLHLVTKLMEGLSK